MLFDGEIRGEIIIRVKNILPNHLSFKNKKQTRETVFFFQKGLEAYTKGNILMVCTGRGGDYRCDAAY